MDALHIRRILQKVTDRVPGSFVENKEFSLAWHYRASDPDLASMKEKELEESLSNDLPALGLVIQKGNKVLEIKDIKANKGLTALMVMKSLPSDFVGAIGDDLTDESVFSTLPQSAYTFKVGLGETGARSRFRDVTEVLSFLSKLD